MKELSIEQKAKTYDEALERAKEMCAMPTDKATMEYIFPELAESEDERIKEDLIQWIDDFPDTIWRGHYKKDILTWLEKQRDYDRLIEEMKKRKELLSKEKEKATSTNDKLSLGGRIAMLQELLAFNICNTTDNAEPKFKVGDFIVNDYCKGKIIELTNDAYLLDTEQGIPFSCEHNIHLWTIQDAKDGDVLVTDFGEDDLIVMYKSRCTIDTINVHCCLGNEFTCSNIGLFNAEDVKPATKEQRDMLFQKMKEAGYEWDSEKKELRKIDAYQLSENPCSNCTNTKGCITCVSGDQKSTSTPRILYSDEVIEWIDEHVPTKFEDMQNYVKQFKKDFGLC